MIKLYRRKLRDASLDETETVAEIVADVRQYAQEELGISPFEELDAAIEEIIVLTRDMRSGPREEGRGVHGPEPDEATEEETKTA